MTADVQDRYLGRLAQGVWLMDHPVCPRCGLRLHKDDPMVGYEAPPEATRRLYLKHSVAVYVDTDGCVTALGRAVALLNERLAILEAQ